MTIGDERAGEQSYSTERGARVAGRNADSTLQSVPLPVLRKDQAVDGMIPWLSSE